MEFNYSGSTHGTNGKGGFINHADYLGTTADGTPSHSNPKKDEYFRAKADYAKTGNHADLLIMSRDSIYLARDIRTFTNMKGRSKADFIRNERKLMRGTGRNVKSVDFVVSPSPKGDKLDPNNPHDVNILEDYMTMLIHNAFNGYFTKTKRKTKAGYHKTKFRRTKGDRFDYYAVIQPDSHDNSNMHGHVVCLNYDLTNGNGMKSSYYGRNHLKQTVKRTTAQWNRLHPEHQMTGVNRKLTGKREPSRIVEPIIKGITAELSNPNVTSQRKLINGLEQNYHVKAKRLRKTKRRKHAGWKFRWTGGKRRHSWISSTRLTSYVGGTGLSAKAISDTLHKHLVDRMNAHKTIKQLNNAPIVLGRASVSPSSVVSSASSSSASVSSWPFSHENEEQSYMKAQLLSASVSASVSNSISVSASALSVAYTLHTSPRIQYGRASKSTAPKHDNEDYPKMTMTMNRILPKLSSDKVRKSAPVIFPTLQTSSRINQNTGLRRFQVISDELDYTNHDIGLFRSFIDPLLNGLRSTSDKVKHWAKSKVNGAKSDIKAYFHSRGWGKLLTCYRQYGIHRTISYLISGGGDIPPISPNGGGTPTSAGSLSSSSVSTTKAPSATSVDKGSLHDSDVQRAIRITKGSHRGFKKANKLDNRDKRKHKSYMKHVDKEDVIKSGSSGISSGMGRSGSERE